MFGMMIIEIKKNFVVNNSLIPLTKCLVTLQDNPKLYYKKLHITFDGYDDDVREIYEIPEIRNWCIAAVKKYPELFYFLEVQMEGQKNIIVCIADIEAFQPGPRKSILQWHKEGFNTTDENFPKISIKVRLSEKIFENLVNGLFNFGENINDVRRVEKLVNELKMYV